MDPRVLGARVRISDERKRDDSEPAARLARSASDVHSAELARLLATLSEGTHGREGVEVARLIEEEELDYETIKRLDLDDLVAQPAV